MKNQYSWAEVDAKLQNEGLLLLAGAVATYQCSSPIWGIIFGLSYFFTIAHLHDNEAKKWQRNIFEAKLDGGSLKEKKSIKYRVLLMQLKQDYPKRDLFAFTLGYWLLVATIFYQAFLYL